MRDKPIMANIEGNDEDIPLTTTSPVGTRFAEDSGFNEEEVNGKITSKPILRQTSSNTSQTNSMISPKKKELNNQNSNNTISSSVEYKKSTIRQHYYPEGGWGWVVVICVMFSCIIQSGLQLSYAVILFDLIIPAFGGDKYMTGSELNTSSKHLFNYLHTNEF